MSSGSSLSAGNVLSPFFPRGLPETPQAAAPFIDDFLNAIRVVDPSGNDGNLPKAAATYETDPIPPTRELLLEAMAQRCTGLGEDKLAAARNAMGLPRRVDQKLVEVIVTRHPAAQVRLVGLEQVLVWRISTTDYDQVPEELKARARIKPPSTNVGCDDLKTYFGGYVVFSLAGDGIDSKICGRDEADKFYRETKVEHEENRKALIRKMTGIDPEAAAALNSPGLVHANKVTPALFYRVGDLFRTNHAGITLIQADGEEVFAEKGDWLRLRWLAQYNDYNGPDFPSNYQWQATVIKNDPKTGMPVGFIPPKEVDLDLPFVDLDKPVLTLNSITKRD